jgi:hypothetical protein
MYGFFFRLMMKQAAGSGYRRLGYWLVQGHCAVLCLIGSIGGIGYLLGLLPLSNSK